MAIDEREYNFVVVGSGAAGLVGAITASMMGLRPLIVEKADVWGGTTAISGGVLWIPGNDLMVQDGDGAGAADTYVRALLGEVTPRETAKAEAFLSAAPEMARMLTDEGLNWIRSRTHPDYYPHVQGSSVGRTLEAARFDGKTLGKRFESMRAAELDLPAITSDQFGTVTRAKTALGPFLGTAVTVGSSKVRSWLGQKPLGNGRALAASLMKIAMARRIPIRLSTRLVELVETDGAITGVVVESENGREKLDAPAGVLLAAGGFARNASLRKKLQDRDRVWTNAIPEDEGDAYVAATAVGADDERTDDCWWMPSIQVSSSTSGLALGLRALPGSIVVNAEGRRYMNEAASYMTTGKTMFENGAADADHWLIMDGKFLKRYIFAELSQKTIRDRMMADGFLKRASNITDLARQCGMDPSVLEATVARFNGFARAGRDLDFGRGDTDYDRHWADPNHKPNPSLGEICHPPFWAAILRPGDLGTNGGLKTDERARVLDGSDRPIVGLYAAGNSASSPFGRTYPGAGATIAAAATFGYIAATDAARRLTNAPVEGST
ncbi:FAD-binding protein [Croceicoccus pelagius]|uniref:3-oxosteroid 1-dehydrogenase n=1 Tax=Croceicoccus pelagius TaxID=1703341 RepID=A0A916Y8N7_9SPHN|nr:FAD-binding protein [Croceicoccus pelagius]GGD34483.1 3-oxosteroid 1-dehydrogenase [Croceicoccus pelagius]